jgi:hypothetical protein
VRGKLGAQPLHVFAAHAGGFLLLLLQRDGWYDQME